MKTQTTNSQSPGSSEALVWIDHAQAVILEQGRDGTTAVDIVVREPSEEEATFEGRTVDHVVDQDRIVVSGPAYARTEFERAYVAVTHRPDRLVDVAPRTRVPRRAI